MIYEERRSTLRRGSAPEFLRQQREELWPALASAGARPLCLMSGLIGAPANELLQVTGFADAERWQQAQEVLSRRGEFVESEEARLLRAVSSRPRDALGDDDRRSIYGYRRFFIHAADLDEFVHCSGDGVWPRIEAQGARILGLWTTVATTEPLEVVLLTGYRGPGHWEETRADLPMPDGFDSELWDRGRRLLARRNELTLRSWVVLMRATMLDGAPA